MPGLSIGTVYVSVAPSTEGFAEKLRAKLLPEADALGRSIGERIGAGINSALRDVSVTVTADTVAADADLADVKANLDDLAKDRPSAKVSVDIADADAGLTDVKAKLDDLAAARPSAKVAVDVADADARVAQIRARMDRLNSVIARPEVTPQIADAQARIDKLQQKLDALGREDATPKVTADTAAAQAKLATLTARLDELKQKDTQVRVRASADLLKAQADLDRVLLKLGEVGHVEAKPKLGLDDSSFNEKLNKAMARLKAAGGPAWLGPALLLAPAATSLAGATAGVAVGLAGAFTAAAGALAGFAAVAVPVLSDAKTAAAAAQTAEDAHAAAIGKVTGQYQYAMSIATTKAQKDAAYAAEQKGFSAAGLAQTAALSKAYAGLSPAQIALSKQIGGMADAWGKVKAAEAPVVAGALQPWLKSITDLMGGLKPIIDTIAPVIHDLGVKFDALVNSDVATRFRDFVASFGAWSVWAIGGTIIDFLKAFMIILPKFTPLIGKATEGIAGLGPAVLKWAGSKATADHITAFMDWFSKNGPAVWGVLKDVGKALAALAPGLTTGALGELDIMSKFFQWVAKLPPAIAKPLIEVAGALLLLNKLGVFSVGVKIVGAAAGWVRKLITGGSVALSGTTAAAEMRAAFASGGAAAAAEIRAAMGTGGATAGAEIAAAEGTGGAAAGSEIVAAEAAGAASIGTAIAGALGVGLLAYMTWDNLKKNLPPQFQKLMEQGVPTVGTAQGVQPAGPTQGAGGWSAPTGADLQKDATVLQRGLTFGQLQQNTAALNAYNAAIKQHGVDSAQAATAKQKLIALEVSEGTMTAPQATAAVKKYTDAYTANTSSATKNQQAHASVTEAVAAYGAQVKVSGTNTVAANVAFNNAATAIANEGTAMTKTHVPAALVYQDMQKQIAVLKSKGPLNSQETAQLGQLQAQMNKVAYSNDGLTKAQNTAAASIKTNLMPQLTALHANTPTVRTDMDNLSNSILNTGTKSQATKSARDQLIADLKKSGVNADIARQFVDGYIAKLGQIPADERTHLRLNGDGTWSVTNAQGQTPGQKTHAALGGVLPGYQPGVDIIPVMASPGEGFLVPEAVVGLGGPPAVAAINRRFAGHRGAGMDFGVGGVVPGFAGGGTLDVTGVPQIATDAAAHVQDTNSQMIAEMKRQMLAEVAKLKAAAAAKAAAMSAAAAGKPGGGVEQWRGLVLKALAMLGLPASLVNAVLYQMQTESGGNPQAINLTDSNAAAGHPSKGLMQVIAGTFAAYHVAGTSNDIYDPLANIAAALNYAAHNNGFGTGVGQVGSGHGYDAGGWLPPGLTLTANNTGQPEAVLTGRQWDMISSAVTGGDGVGLGGRAMAKRLDRMIHLLEQAPGRTGGAFAEGINSTARGAVTRAYFRTR